MPKLQFATSIEDLNRLKVRRIANNKKINNPKVAFYDSDTNIFVILSKTGIVYVKSAKWSSDFGWPSGDGHRSDVTITDHHIDCWLMYRLVSAFFRAGIVSEETYKFFLEMSEDATAKARAKRRKKAKDIEFDLSEIGAPLNRKQIRKITQWVEGKGPWASYSNKEKKVGGMDKELHL